MAMVLEAKEQSGLSALMQRGSRAFCRLGGVGTNQRAEGAAGAPPGQLNWQPGGFRPTHSPLGHCITSMVHMTVSGRGAGVSVAGEAQPVKRAASAISPAKVDRNLVQRGRAFIPALCAESGVAEAPACRKM
jgi:hypothetical protein